MLRPRKLIAHAAISLLVLPSVALAQEYRGIGKVINKAMRDTALFAGFVPENGQPRNFIQILGGYTNGIITLLGLIFLVLIIWAGFKWMTAAGNEDQVTKARGYIKNAAIGLTIILVARMITYLLLEIIQPAVSP
ncbi:MAG: hypothetical protein Q7S23_03510 [bacterium]|nr:hypothetical protein [bacterium]